MLRVSPFRPFSTRGRARAGQLMSWPNQRNPSVTKADRQARNATSRGLGPVDILMRLARMCRAQIPMLPIEFLDIGTRHQCERDPGKAEPETGSRTGAEEAARRKEAETQTTRKTPRLTKSIANDNPR